MFILVHKYGYVCIYFVTALGNMGSSFKTPRSKSATNRTPTSNRQPLANLQSNGPKRSSIYGRGSISSKGQAKENRPLNDRDWQRDVVRELVTFCIDNNFPKLIMTCHTIYINSSGSKKVF